MAWSESQSATWDDLKQAWLRARVEMLTPVLEIPDGLMTHEGQTVAYVMIPLDPRAQ